MPGEFPIATPQFGDAINVPGQTTKRYRKVVSVPCTTRTCAVVFPPDVETYSLQDSIFFNATALSFLVTCPPGRVCPPGTYPRVITYPPGTFIMPDPNVTPGFPIYLAMTGCQSVVSRYLDADATAAEISAAAQEIIYEVAQQQAQCDAVADDPEPPAPNFRNQQVFALVDCPEDTQLEYSGTLPSYLTLDVINSRVVMTAGVVSGLTQAAANAVAQAIVDDWTDSKFTAGTLSCEPIAPQTFPDFEYTLLFGNTFQLSAATINTEDFLTGFPVNGSLLGSTILTEWTTYEHPGFPGFTIAYQGEAAVGVSEGGTYRFQVTNATTTVPWLNNHYVEAFVNEVSVFYYNLDTTTGTHFDDLVLAQGDVLKFIFAVDGDDPVPYGSYETEIEVTKL